MEQDPIRKEDVLMIMVINVTKTKTLAVTGHLTLCALHSSPDNSTIINTI